MKPRLVRNRIHWFGAQDWNRELFESLVPLPEGTSYNSYIVEGIKKCAMIDTVDPSLSHVMMEYLDGFERIHYIISLHAEQDHSGSIPLLLERFDFAKVVTSVRGKEMLMHHLHIDPDRILTVTDGDTIDLGDKTLKFVHTPWAHWPETMCCYVREDRVLFTGDLFGSHLASTDMFVYDETQVYNAAKRYYAEVLMPFAHHLGKNIQKLRELDFEILCPSHGPIHTHPDVIMGWYDGWLGDRKRNKVLIPYVSMHGSTELMVTRLVSALVDRGISAVPMDMARVDIGRLTMGLVTAPTLIIGAPSFNAGAHPLAIFAASTINALRPKVRQIGIIGSYGWSSRAVEQLKQTIPSLNGDFMEPVYIRGKPDRAAYERLDALADTIADLHRKQGLME